MQTAYLRVQVLALYNVSELLLGSYFGLNLNPIKPVLTLGISRCRQISNLCLYRSLAKRDTAYKLPAQYRRCFIRREEKIARRLWSI